MAQRDYAAPNFSIDTHHGIVYVDLPGVTSLESLFDAVRRLMADLRWSPTFDVLVECRPCNEGSERWMVPTLARLWRLLPEDLFLGRCAILADWPDAYERALTLEALCQGSARDLRAFRSPAAAIAWLEAAHVPV